MTSLILAAAFFAFIHIGLSATGLRAAAVGALGENLYRGLFSLASLVGIVWLAMAYNAAFPGPELWYLGPGVSHLGILVMAIAVPMAVIGLTTKNPTSVGFESSAGDPATVQGILRVTRHPFLWSVAIWAAFHLLANGDAASAILFGSLLIVAVAGTFSIDRKRRAAQGEAYAGFERATSNIPFAAILGGRQSFRFGEIAPRLLLGLAVFAALLLVHRPLFGASPFPGGWAPF